MSDRFWTDTRVRQALGLEEDGAGPSYRRVSTDTRGIGEGDLFVALRGERFDAHAFLDLAFASGAAGAVIDDPSAKAPAGLTTYHVDDTLVALGKLGAYRRAALAIPFIGVVGSNGKTTTKELIRSALKTKYRTYATEGNLNNLVGVPLTLLGLPDDVEAAVIEMGTDRPGEIATLTGIVKPDHAVITSIGEEHLERLGDLEGVLLEETSILDGLPPGGKAFVADEPDALPRRAREVLGRGRVRVAGYRDGSDLRPDGGGRAIRVLEDGSTLWRWRGVDVRLPIPGRINVRNALLALGVATELGVDTSAAVHGIAGVTLPRFRGEWVHFGNLRVLADCYNANPPSLAAAVDLLASLPTKGRRVAVLGTMRELGEASEQLHAAAADHIARLVGDRIDLVVATGDFVPAFERHAGRLGEQLVLNEDPVAAFEQARPLIRETDTILLKASRGARLERWLEQLERQF